METDLKGLLSDVVHVNEKTTGNQYRLTIKRFKRLPEGDYALMIEGCEWVLTVRNVDLSENGSEIHKVGYLKRKGFFNSYHFSEYCKGSGYSIEVIGYELSFGLMRGAFHINQTNLIGQIKA